MPKSGKRKEKMGSNVQNYHTTKKKLETLPPHRTKKKKRKGIYQRKEKGIGKREREKGNTKDKRGN